MFLCEKMKKEAEQETETRMPNDTKEGPQGAFSPETDDTRRKPPTLRIDWDLYGAYLAESDLSDAEKRDFIETLWKIAVSFVDLGFGLHPTQLATDKSCEQKSGSPAEMSGTVLDYLSTTQAEFAASAHHESGPAQRERSPE